MKFPVIKVRRLKIFGTAMLLSAVAAAHRRSRSTSPRRRSHRSAPSATSSPSTTRSSRVRGQGWLVKLLHLPDNDPPNDNIRLVAIDEASLQDPPKGLGYPVQRTAIGDLLRKLAKGGAKIVAFDIEFFEHSHDPKRRCVVQRRFAQTGHGARHDGRRHARRHHVVRTAAAGHREARARRFDDRRQSRRLARRSTVRDHVDGSADRAK